MQTLNVGAGQTDDECKAHEKERRADLRSEAKSDANYFFLAAGLAALGTGFLPLRVNIIVNIGVVDLLTFYGRPLGHLYPAAVFGAAWLWLVMLIALGFAARRGHRWAFLAGILLYAADMIALIVTFSIWAFGVHAFFLLKWFQGQKALKDSREAAGVDSLQPADPSISPAAGQ
jgi:hypothetical protein